MNYIKNNKIFIFLVTCLLGTILYMSYLLGAFDTFLPTNQNDPYSNVGEYGKSSIVGFNGKFSNDKHSVYLTWNVVQVDQKIENVSIYQDGLLLKEVTGERSVSLQINEYEFKTGNNSFQIKATLKDGTILDKNTYVYIDEAFDFNVKEIIQDKKIIFEVTYFMDIKKPVNAPNVSFSGISESLSIAFLSSEEIERENDYAKMKAIYELDFGNAKVGRYTLPILWTFDLYNLEFNTTTTLEVEGNNG